MINVQKRSIGPDYIGIVQTEFSTRRSYETLKPQMIISTRKVFLRNTGISLSYYF